MLLPAGAFDTIDEEHGRRSGAAGALVNPLEPTQVIRLVKDLLGMSPKVAHAELRGPAAAPGRMRPPTDAPAHAGSTRATELPAALASGRRETQTWEEPRERPGPAPAAPAVERPGMEHEVVPVHSPAGSVAVPGSPAAETAPGVTAVAPGPEAPRLRTDAARPGADEPVDGRAAVEVDTSWFTPRSDERSDIRDFDWLLPEEYGPPAGAAGAAAPSPSREREATSPVVAPAWRLAAPGPADAFALLWAQEQGEPLPASPHPAPVDLTSDTVAAVSHRLSQDIAPRITEDLARRLTTSLSQHLGESVVDRLTAALAGPLADQVGSRVLEPVSATVADRLSALPDRMAEGVADRLAAGIADRLVQEISERISDRIADRLTAPLSAQVDGMTDRLIASLGDRLSTGLGDYVGSHVAEQMLQTALGDSLRQTVRDVAERLVRDEIARMRSAAGDTRA